jgi:hypothetical protein
VALRAPVFAPALLLSVIATLPVYASVTVGSWVEAALRQAGVDDPPGGLMAAAGVVLYLAVGLVLPVWAGLTALGWWAGVFAPLLVLAIIARLGRW